MDGAVVGLGVDHLPVDLDAFGAAELTASEARLRPAVGWCAADELGGAAPLRGDGEVESRSHGPLFAAFDGVGEAFAGDGGGGHVSSVPVMSRQIRRAR
ncbi:hypothetical protein DW322_21485 [Rhodococcus rhodnii]|uniref:Uncharacterized protein n=1 Tax=Rhodococcus rhodnii TaxID=38312 RepID=A0A6P2C818_9NOCA|nr:hypothetical protein DW322_21485 [Rhodococcus rhodnii]